MGAVPRPRREGRRRVLRLSPPRTPGQAARWVNPPAWPLALVRLPAPAWLGRAARRLRPPPALELLLPLLAGALGACLAVALLAREEAQIGPATVRLAAHPALTGSSTLEVPPFGSVSARTHAGPLALGARLASVDVQELGRIIAEQHPLRGGLRDTGFPATLAALERQARSAARDLLARVAVLGLAGGVAAVVLFPRRTRRRLAATAAGGLAATAAMLVPTLLTYDLSAFSTPRYRGALEYAPVLIGDARTAIDRLQTLREEMVRVGESLDRAYTALAEPVPEVGNGTVRILHVSDLHLNPAGFDLAQQLAERFDVQAVVDTGDMGTWGFTFERDVPRHIAGFDVPYLFVKGNHDNQAMVEAVAANRNARVLDGTATEVAGIRFYGLADPTFSPGQGWRVPEFKRLKAERSALLAAELEAMEDPPDVLLVHDPALATYVAGRVPTVLTGHMHRSSSEVRNGTRQLTIGSTGGAGPDGLRAPQPVPYEAEVLYFDPATRRPFAVDRISVQSLERAFSLDRELLPEGQAPFTPDPVPLPPPSTAPAPPGPLPRSGP